MLNFNVSSIACQYLQRNWVLSVERDSTSCQNTDCPCIQVRPHNLLISGLVHPSIFNHLTAYNVEPFESLGTQSSVKELTLWICVETSP